MRRFGITFSKKSETTISDAAQDKRYTPTQLLRLLTIAGPYIIPFVDKYDVREGKEGCPEQAIEDFTTSILPLLEGKDVPQDQLVQAFTDLRRKLINERDILKVFLQVIKDCFNHIELFSLEDRRLKDSWQQLQEMLKTQLKKELEMSKGNWKESTTKYRENPKTYFETIDYEQIQTPFFQFFIRLRKSAYNPAAEALFQFLFFMRQVALKKVENDPASQDENLFGMAFNLVPILRKALKLENNIFTEELHKQLLLPEKDKPGNKDWEKIELFFLKRMVFAWLKAPILGVEFTHADFTVYAPIQPILAPAPSLAEVSPPGNRKHVQKVQSLRRLNQVKRELAQGNQQLHELLERSPSVSVLPELDDVQKKELIEYRRRLTNRQIKEGLEKLKGLDLAMGGLSLKNEAEEKSSSKTEKAPEHNSTTDTIFKM